MSSVQGFKDELFAVPLSDDVDVTAGRMDEVLGRFRAWLEGVHGVSGLAQWQRDGLWVDACMFAGGELFTIEGCYVRAVEQHFGR